MPEQHSDDPIIIHLEYLREGVDGINARLDGLNGRTRQNEQDIAVLKDRSEDNRIAAAAAKTSGAKWGAGIAAFGSAVATALWHYMTGAK